MSSSTAPLVINPDAAERVAQLGLQHEFEQIVEYTCRNVPGLLGLEVTLAPAYDAGDEPGVILEASVPYRPATDLGVGDRWRDWVLATFPPDVWRHFTLMNAYVPPDER
jgi:hypothetical protein